jgi:hypothetical protein
VSPATDAGVQHRPAPRSWQRRLVRRSPTHALLLHGDALWDAGSTRQPHRPTRWHESFEAWCGAMPGAACELLLSGTLVHDLVCEPDLPLVSDKQLLEHARAVFVHYHGEEAALWRMACWSAGPHCGVSALHGADFGELLAMALRHEVRILAMRPWWARVLALTLRRLPALRTMPRAWLMIAEGRFVTALRLEQGHCAQLHTRWLDDASPQALADFAAWLPDGAAKVSAEPVRLAAGYGLAPGIAPGVEVLGQLDATAPPCVWFFELGTRP